MTSQANPITVKRRDPGRGNQLIALVTETDAAAIRDEVAQGRRSRIQGNSDAVDFAPDEGWFYLIQRTPARSRPV
jgi:glutamate-1-semialdehyde aminotransferase